MKILTKHSFDANNCRKEWNEFVQLLAQNQGSPEQRVIIKAYHEKQAKKRFRILSKFINP
jgi:hypothetical protein